MSEVKYKQLKGVPRCGDVIRYGSAYYKLSIDKSYNSSYFVATAQNDGKDGSMLVKKGDTIVVHREFLPHFTYVPE